MELTIECKSRDAKAKPNALRREGLLPVVLYGHQGTESVSLTVNQKDADLLLRKAAVNNTMIDLKIPDMPWNGKALLREVQAHPWKKTVYHLSFFAVKAQDFVEVGVVLNFVGEPTGVKDDGGVLNTEINEVTVKCKAIDIPEAIEVDVSGLAVGDSLTVADLVLPEGAVVAGDQTQTIATVLQGRMAEGEGEAEAAAE
ncbi:50S ribosomal protein L25/general stress protein Ctc [Phormidium tenue]|uniref:Large ribosomal subunit protein bL25 n=1 Tax=Phormidium tenue NIES-30 TaxID=549789 RepID=A0A1U7JA74_9CYAN|nr:50S ribosomal protein L25/general stress protein Ctc [Phormidium tenue]MBD2230664.1 50S ribosomal protein L25/general stress protein Ctc [Phormidium tenue FACHB-1052]OKH50579.1 50S ribosomal protein L25/general stress protein Ctc [Phormidium tenue NIES-30]